MSGFVLLLPVAGGRVSADVRRRWSPPGSDPGGWRDWGGASVLRWSAPHEEPPELARVGLRVAVGVLRLENPDALRRVAAVRDECLSDLELVTRVLDRHGPAGAARLEGDFAFVIADPVAGRAIAARDAFGIVPLYHACRGGVMAFASRAAWLADGDAYDTRYLAEFAAGVTPAVDRTPFAGVQAVPPAGVVRVEGASIQVERYWSPFDFTPRAVTDEQAAVDEFRSLLEQAVRRTLTGDHRTWSELSGGLDSSSVVCLAEAFRRRGEVGLGVAGTVTYADSVGAGSDERAYSDRVVSSLGLRNEVLADYVPLQEMDRAPVTDLPDVRYLLCARDARVVEVVRSAGGTVLLSGLGADHYLMGNMLFFADWAARGRFVRAAREAVRWASLGRVSAWRLAYLDVVLPLLPGPVRRRLLPEAHVPAWIPKSLARRYDLAERYAGASGYAGPFGAKYAHETAYATASIASAIDRGIVADALAVRYPFCHRPLVEFCLRLPPELCRRPNARKWIMREAMRGILPEEIRTRRWKGTYDGRVVWALRQHRALIESLFERPLLGDLGCVDPAPVRAGIGAAMEMERFHARATLLSALALEAWLRVRSGQWVIAASQGEPIRARTTGG